MATINTRLSGESEVLPRYSLAVLINSDSSRLNGTSQRRQRFQFCDECRAQTIENFPESAIIGKALHLSPNLNLIAMIASSHFKIVLYDL